MGPRLPGIRYYNMRRLGVPFPVRNITVGLFQVRPYVLESDFFCDTSTNYVSLLLKSGHPLKGSWLPTKAHHYYSIVLSGSQYCSTPYYFSLYDARFKQHILGGRRRKRQYLEPTLWAKLCKNGASFSNETFPATWIHHRYESRIRILSSATIYRQVNDFRFRGHWVQPSLCS